MSIMLTLARQLLDALDFRDRVTFGAGYAGSLLAVVLPSFTTVLGSMQVIGAGMGIVLTGMMIVTAWRKMPPKQADRRKR